MDFFSDELRRDPFPAYGHMRRVSPVFRVPPPFDAWMVFDYESVKRVLTDHHAFSSRVPAPKNWFIFSDPPKHTKSRALISKAFTPRVIADLEPRINALSKELLDAHPSGSAFDLSAEYSVPLPMKVIAEMIGIPASDWLRFRRWSDVVIAISFSRSGGPEAEAVMSDFRSATVEMQGYLGELIADRKRTPRDDLLTQLVAAEVDGERLTPDEILGFFQLLLVGGQETTANLINNTILSLVETPAQFAMLRANPDLLPRAIEESLRFRAPFQWLMRTPTQDVQLHGQQFRPGELVLAMVGSANRDSSVFPTPDAFDITRDPNPHLAFGHGPLFCLGAALARMEARIALTDLLDRYATLELAEPGPWEPRKALHVYGPTRLRISTT